MPKSAFRLLAVHPRARGEHLPEGVINTRSFGSSPRTRGTSCRHSLNCRQSRFIPAHAGNISPSISARSFLAVHPRARGEHSFFYARLIRQPGSSPRTRGTLGRVREDQGGSRFIPAHAGNIYSQQETSRKMAVHPRARGEHQICLLEHSPKTGSSPRTRGTFSAQCA